MASDLGGDVVEGVWGVVDFTTQTARAASEQVYIYTETRYADSIFN